MTKYNKSELADLLRNGTYQVTFIKKDGTERVMKCSLAEDVLAPILEVATTREKEMLKEGISVSKKADNPDVLSVVDIEKSAWRSFRLDSIKDVTKLN